VIAIRTIDRIDRHSNSTNITGANDNIVKRRAVQKRFLRRAVRHDPDGAVEGGQRTGKREVGAMGYEQ
jgi:hypothetical protein